MAPRTLNPAVLDKCGPHLRPWATGACTRLGPHILQRQEDTLPCGWSSPHPSGCPKRLEKALSGILSPTPSPNSAGEQRARGREGERAEGAAGRLERERNANGFYPPFF